MAVRIGSNISSLQAQRRLSDTSSALSNTYERLSSGQRINRASDDAAGLAIAGALRVSSRITAQGVRNLNDTVSYLTITESATRELKNIIIRGKELAEQSANGVYSSSQREALDKELQTLGKEYNRIIESTSFNGRKVFERAGSTLQSQAGDSVIGASLLSDEISSVDKIMRVSADGNSQSRNRSQVSMSADGRYVVFDSYADNLVAGDGNGTGDVFVRDLQTGSISRLSESSSGAEGNAESFGAAISADGRYVVFQSSASNLVAGDGNGTTDIFIKDLQTGSLRRVSESSDGTEGNGGSSNASISADGRYVVFASSASNLDGGGNGVSDIFVKDLETGSVTRASTSASGVEGNSFSYAPSISADGRYVAFQSISTNLVSGDGNAAADIFVKDLATGSIRRVSTDSSGAEGNGGSGFVSISADGRYVTFSSDSSNLVAGDGNGATDIFIKDLESGSTRRVSTSSSGQEANADSYTPSISADGRYVVFHSRASSLVTGDGNGATDVFLKDLQTGTLVRLSVSESGREATNSNDGSGSFSACINADGRYVVFSSDMLDLLDGATTGFFESVYATVNSLAFQTSLNPFEAGSLTIRTQSTAKTALGWLDRYMDELNTFGGAIGSSTSRLDVAKNVLSAMHENFNAAESRIRDADIAEESAKLVRNQILQQVASSVLAQANQEPALAIRLLSGWEG